MAIIDVSSDSGTDAGQTTPTSGLEQLQAALDETSIGQVINDQGADDCAPIDQGPVDQRAINRAVEKLRGEFNAELSALRADHQEQIATIREELAAAIATNAGSQPAVPSTPSEPATPNTSRRRSWREDIDMLSNRHGHGHVARNEGSGNSVFQSGGPGNRARNHGSGNSISQRGPRPISTTQTFVLLGALGLFTGIVVAGVRLLARSFSK
ncbi:hypothetical protein F4818DRAFT_399345 [Hypoxylon cercidicola]|nr:hypothetical protein F4818DRAFT_399345 [Hypoxylon cercidicola]